MKKQLIPAVALALLFVLLTVGYFAVLRPLLADKPADDPVLPTPVDDIEQITANGQYLIFPYTTRENIQSFSVRNEHGSYRFYRDANDAFVVDGHETLAFGSIVFSAIVNAVGYPLASAKICDNATPEQFAEYGLDAPVASWTLETIHGDIYTVEVGDETLAENGSYYCRLVGRDSIYLLSLSRTVFSDDYATSKSMDVVLEPLEAFITVSLAPGLTAQNYYMVNEIMMFTRGTGDNLPCLFYVTSRVLDNVDASATASPDADTGLTELTFSYPNGYQVNSALVWETIYNFSIGEIQPLSCLKIDPTEEDIAGFGLDHPYRVFRFTTRKEITTKTGAKRYEDVATITMTIGDLREDNTYPLIATVTAAGSDEYLAEPVVVAVSAEDFAFIEEPQFSWISPNVFPANIRSVASLRVRTADNDVTFTLHHDVETSTYLGTDGQFQTQYKYLLDVTTDTGLTIPNSEIDNFRLFYITLLGITIRGEAGVPAEEAAAIFADESRRALSFTYTTTAGKTYELSFWYYTDSGRRVLVNANGGAEFYVFSDDIAEVGTSLEQVLRGIRVDPYRP